MSKHTPTPWGFGSGLHVRKVEKGHKDRSIIGTFSTHLGREEMEANGRRIVAAVNACEGISTKALEEGVVKDLLEACRAALYGVVDRGGPDGLSQAEVVGYLTAAIAKAGKE